MGKPLLFWEVVEAADQLSSDEQETLLDILRRRLAELGRKQIVDGVAEARQELAQGMGNVKTVEEIMRDVRP